MLVTTTLGRSQFGRTQFGDDTAATPAEEALVPLFTDRVLTLSAQENELRKTFAQLLPDLTALQAVNQTIPDALLTLLQSYNVAQATFMEAAQIWLQARANTPSSSLPDPNAQAIAVPTFDLGASSAPSGFGFAGIPASSIRIRYGIVGQEVSTPLGSYIANYGYNGFSGLGDFGAIPGLVWAILLGFAILGATVVLALRAVRTSDTAAANNAITAQAQGRIQEVQSDRDLFVSTRDTCIGGSQDIEVRRQCIASAASILKMAKEGRPVAIKPISPTTVGLITVVGVLGVLGVAGGIGYAIHKRKQREHGGGDDFPRATAHRSSGRRRPSHDDDYDYDETD